MNLKFIIALTEHRVYGSILAPYLISKNETGSFYTIKSLVLKSELSNYDYRFTPSQKQIIELITKYSDDNIARKFSGKFSGTEFFQNIDKDFFDETVSPYIEKQIVTALDLICEANIPIYRKSVNYINIYEDERIFIQPKYTVPIFCFNLTNNELSYHLKIQQNDGKLVRIFRKNPLIIANKPSRLLIGKNLYRFEKIASKKISPFFVKESVQIPSSVTDKYLRTFVLSTIRDQQVEANGFSIEWSNPEKKAIITIEENLKLEPIVCLYFQYGTKRFSANMAGKIEVEVENKNNHYTFYKHKRDLVWEQDLLNQLAQLGAILNNENLVPIEITHTSKSFIGYDMINWLNKNEHPLLQIGIDIEQHISTKKYFTGTQKLTIDINTENDWFDLYAMVEFGSFKFPFIRLKKHISKGIREFELPNGEIVILPLEWFSQFKELMPFANGKDEHLKFSKFHFHLLKSNLQPENTEQLEALSDLDFSTYQAIPIPTEIKATLREYQAVGFSWMHFLNKNGFGGCLADDMGLGKTLQTLTLLLKLKLEQTTQQKQASLLILPTSLVHNWKNEVKKFTPQLKTYLHTGTKRKKMSNFSGVVNYYDLIITTYGTIRNDIDLLKTAEFNYLILDESQYIKNPSSKTYQVVCELQSKHKLVLTGTPIENSLSDLWSQINFLNRGILGSFTFFKKEFIVPIEKNFDEDKQKQLQNLISPFILRRTKEAVAKDLPPLTEQVRICKMSVQQSKIYEAEKSAIRNSLLQNFESVGVEKSSLLVLQGLTRLRQLANHPEMLEFDSDSGKFEEIKRIIENLIAEKHKVLLFSSFVKLLTLFKTEFEKEGWEYSLLTGQSRNREEIIHEFQTNESKQLFLISLKAGGVGLNLTAADYIFILDPWWNPAAEAQAINRAHRIGQDKKVFVYRFISESTIEEKILLHQQRKTQLAELFINSNNPMQQIKKDEIIKLFS